MPQKPHVPDIFSASVRPLLFCCVLLWVVTGQAQSTPQSIRLDRISAEIGDVQAALQAAPDQGQAQPLQLPTDGAEYESAPLLRDHRTYWAIIAAACMLASGFLVLLVVKSRINRELKREIEERELTERALQESSFQIESILRAAPIGIGLVQDRVLMRANQRLCLLTGYDRSELIGRSARMLYVNDADYAYVGEEKYRQIRERGIGTVETRWRRKSGEVINVLLSSAPLDQNDWSRGVTFSALDITERKKMEWERARLQRELTQSYKMEALGQLTGGIAHDFNNILGIIVGYTDLARESGINKTRKESYLEKVAQAADRARQLVGQMMLFSRADPEEDKPLLLPPLIKEDIKLLRSTLPSAIRIEMDLMENPPRVMMGLTQLNQLLMNLCINARDAMNGSGTLSIRLNWARQLHRTCSSCHQLVHGDWLELSVTDTGAGIATHAFERLFEPFFTTKQLGKGTGMGLAVVHGIMLNHGGHVLVESKLGSGTSFRLLFPPLQEDAGGLPDPADWQTPTPHGEGRRLLVVDDEIDLARYLGDLMELHGYRVRIVTESGKALALFKEAPMSFDLLLTDQTMPGMSGLELIRECRTIRPDIPAVICSGYSEDLDPALVESADLRCLAKPVDKQRLLLSVGALLHLSSPGSIKKKITGN